MSDHCPACAIARELAEHRDAYYPPWSKVRGALNFTVIVAERACPDYEPAKTRIQGDE